MKTKPTRVDVQEKKSFYDVRIHLIYCYDKMILFQNIFHSSKPIISYFLKQNYTPYITNA
jgi:hypothetical protein